MSAKRPSSARPTPARRSGSIDRSSVNETPTKKNDDVLYECKAAYLVDHDDLTEHITSRDQLRDDLQQSGRNPSRTILDKYWKHSTDFLTFDDFVRICKKIPPTTKNDLMKAFRKIDLDSNGYITNNELLKVLTTRGDKMTKSEVQTIIDEVDENGDGKLDYEEFCRMMLDTQDAVRKVAHERLERKEKRQKSDFSPKPRSKAAKTKDQFGSQSSLSEDKTRADAEKEKLGSQTSLKSTTKEDAEMGSQISVKSTSSTRKSELNKMGSQVSLRSVVSEKMSEAKHEVLKDSLKPVESTRKLSVSESAESSDVRPTETKAKEKTGKEGEKMDSHDKKAKEKESEEKNAQLLESKGDPEPKPSEAPSSDKKSAPDSDDDDDIVVGSQVSLRTPRPSPKKDTSSRMGSQTSLRSARSVTKCENDNAVPKPRPRKSRERDMAKDSETDEAKSSHPKERTRSPVALKKIRLPEPKRLKDWAMTHSKGCFFFEEDGTIVSHQYSLHLSKDTSVWITIEPMSLGTAGDMNSAREIGAAPRETALLVLRERPDEEGNILVTFTEQRDLKGRYCVRCDLEKGRYILMPLNTGCRFRRRKTDARLETKLVKKDKDDQFVLTKAFKEVLTDMFEVCDLDGNGLLSRDEFNWFNLRTSGEEVADEEWEVVEENVELKNGEMTRTGFLSLNQMEAEDNMGDTDDLWVTLNSMGYNKGLVMDEAVPFIVEVYSEDCNPNMKIIELGPGGSRLERAVCEATINKGDVTRVKNMKDLFLHTYMSDFRACIVIENKSRSTVTMNVDCSRSKNCVSQRDHLDYTLDVPAKTAKVAHHILPASERLEWTLRIGEAVIK